VWFFCCLLISFFSFSLIFWPFYVFLGWLGSWQGGKFVFFYKYWHFCTNDLFYLSISASYCCTLERLFSCFFLANRTCFNNEGCGGEGDFDRFSDCIHFVDDLFGEKIEDLLLTSWPLAMHLFYVWYKFPSALFNFGLKITPIWAWFLRDLLLLVWISSILFFSFDLRLFFMFSSVFAYSSFLAKYLTYEILVLVL